MKYIFCNVFIVILLSTLTKADEKTPCEGCRDLVDGLLKVSAMPLLYYGRERLSFNTVFHLFTSEMAGLLVAWLSTTPPYFATRLY